jgi:hypothetical protein
MAGPTDSARHRLPDLLVFGVILDVRRVGQVPEVAPPRGLLVLVLQCPQRPHVSVEPLHELQVGFRAPVAHGGDGTADGRRFTSGVWRDG